MSTALPAADLLPLPAVGRRYATEHVVRLGDAGPSGELRLDATARLLQDVANDDALDAGLENSFGWVVRRATIHVRRPAVLGERLTLTTFCSGTGRCWAERRTSIVGDRGGALEAAALWVQVDPSTGRPAPLGDGFDRIYGAAAGGRRVSSRCSLPGPPAAAPRRHWAMRRVDLDVLGHVNNAVAWAIVHETLGDDDPGAGSGEIEYPMPVAPDDAPLELVTTDDGGRRCWLVTGDAVRVAARWRPAAEPWETP